jgi:hypothetical protein
MAMHSAALVDLVLRAGAASGSRTPAVAGSRAAPPNQCRSRLQYVLHARHSLSCGILYREWGSGGRLRMTAPPVAGTAAARGEARPVLHQPARLAVGGAATLNLPCTHVYFIGDSPR